MATYVTGDTHRRFTRLFEFCETNHTTIEDTLVILGDAGINIYCDTRDDDKKNELLNLPVTLLCVHGNHEERPFLLGYQEKEWKGGMVYYEEKYPNLLFAKDGEIYDFDGKKAVVIGGAYSVDKYYRLRNYLPWFESEQPTEEIKHYVETQLEQCGWSVDYVFSHTAPIKYEPTWSFLPGINQSLVDKTTERWLQTICDKLTFQEWYAGHYHVDSKEGPITFLLNKYKTL